MRLHVQHLYPIQDDLDSKIFNNHATNRPKTILDRMLALLVELGECANETRCFKYWSVKGPSEKEVIAQEFVDGIHFLLSLGIDLDQPIEVVQSQELVGSVSDQFISVFEAIIALSKHFDAQHYEQAFSLYVGLASKLGISEEEIEEHYQRKNQTNHKRQAENY